MQVFALLGGAVGLYVLTAGADFGGGVWDLLARGPRRERQRELVAEAIAPIWEVNHIWMIFVVVVLFSVFPDAFAVVSTALHIPIVLALVGIVLRGSAFVFRAYGLQPNETRARWGRVFAWASALTPVFLGMIVAAVSSGAIELSADSHGNVYASSGFLAGWTTPFAIAVGVFSLALFALLAAVYLAREAELAGEPQLSDDFRRRALLSELVAFCLALLVLWRARVESPTLYTNLLEAPWSIPAQLLTAALAGGAIVALLGGRSKLARMLVMAQVACIVLGWGLAMDGHLLLPGLRVEQAGAEPAVLAALPWVLLGGSLLFAPALVWLFRVFKTDSSRSA
ncbi:MAG TPA: cytochrome d ubiquinol oxidase subunit II [Enhygromyxa sp.]|nr:cytochrome d ubiquinol oxidase subunit II [Enhygromyxa sp.]